jgi:predicted ATPase
VSGETGCVASWGRKEQSLKRYILTGAPGAGKTVLLRRLEQGGHAVVEEAATDVHALMIGQGSLHPHLEPSFIEDILALQLARQARADAFPDEVVFFDRSPICTLALAEFLGIVPPPALTAELARIDRDGVYERQVFFVENLGFIANTEVRRITFEDTLKFEAVHREVYQRLGYTLVSLPPAPVEARCEAVKRYLETGRT